mmetsp:Transcript_43921/g.77780  ORF Transcript_43921/g.77780 Transcript_43921/m.77780 type:complete len:102 (+) Transcript_43921:382-687(+)
MSRADVMMHPIKDAVWPVNGAKGASQKVPLTIAVMRNFGISVLEPGVENEPEVAPHVRGKVVHGHTGEAEAPASPTQGEESQGTPQGGECNAAFPCFWKQR